MTKVHIAPENATLIQEAQIREEEDREEITSTLEQST